MFHIYKDYHSEYGTIHPRVLFKKGHKSLSSALNVAQKRLKLGKLYITNPQGQVVHILN